MSEVSTGSSSSFEDDNEEVDEKYAVQKVSDGHAMTGGEGGAGAGASEQGEESDEADEEKAQMQFESKPAAVVSLAVIAPPTENDIICDKRSHQHKGNIKFRKLIEKYFRGYQIAKTRKVKGRTTARIIGVVHRAKGRFMRYDDSKKSWVILDSKAEYEKVSNALRSARESKRREKKCSEGGGSAEVQEEARKIFETQMNILGELLEQESDGAGEDDEEEEEEDAKLLASGQLEAEELTVSEHEDAENTGMDAGQDNGESLVVAEV